MSVIVQTRGEVGGGVAAHLQCHVCGHFSKSHAHQLSHMAATHPACLDGVAVGRLGNILMYQSTARLFHCSDCFFTCRDFAKLYKHIISKHCVDEKEVGGVEEGGGDEGSEKGEEGEEEEKEGGKDSLKRKRSSEGEEEEKEEGGKDSLKRMKSSEEEEEKGEEGEEEKEGGKDLLKRMKSSEGEEEKGEEGEEEEKEGGKDLLKRMKSSEAEEEEAEGSESVKPDGEGDEGVLMFDGAGYRCLICGWKNKLKSLGISHVVRKHDIPKAYAAQAVRRDATAAPAAAATPRQTASCLTEEEEVAGLSGELLKEEMKATAKVVRFISNRFVCVICGWKTKLKGFAISHVVRCHDVERPYGCKVCKRSFFLPSRLQQHVRAAHRPGRFACPFCCFRSHFLGGFRRHCSRCNAREEEEEGGGGGGGGGGGKEEEEEEEHEEGEEGEEKKETRGERRRRKTVTVIEEEGEQEEEEDE